MEISVPDDASSLKKSIKQLRMLFSSVSQECGLFEPEDEGLCRFIYLFNSLMFSLYNTIEYSTVF